jgi:hypothetical protein
LSPSHTSTSDFNVIALYEALDAQRAARELSWRQVTLEFASAYSDLADKLAKAGRPVHPFAQSTIVSMVKRKDTTCQHALIMLRWLGRAPEEFVSGGKVKAVPLPTVGADRMLRWHLPALYEALNTERQGSHLTWPQLATEIGCSPGQLNAIHKLKYAIGMVLAMRITGWLNRPAADFVVSAER